MAEWYGEKDGREIGQVLDLSQSQFNMEPHLMLREFWLSLMNQGRGFTVSFHNWSGYDAYLSLEALISLCDHGFTFTPIINHGNIICLTVHQGKNIVLTIKDSLKVIPGAWVSGRGFPWSKQAPPTETKVLVNFFTELNAQFQVNPLNNLSAPGIAFTTWLAHNSKLIHYLFYFRTINKY